MDVILLLLLPLTKLSFVFKGSACDCIADFASWVKGSLKDGENDKKAAGRARKNEKSRAAQAAHDAKKKAKRMQLGGTGGR